MKSCMEGVSKKRELCPVSGLNSLHSTNFLWQRCLWSHGRQRLELGLSADQGDGSPTEAQLDVVKGQHSAGSAPSDLENLTFTAVRAAMCPVHVQSASPGWTVQVCLLQLQVSKGIFSPCAYCVTGKNYCCAEVEPSPATLHISSRANPLPKASGPWLPTPGHRQCPLGPAPS